jgi:hypothetical protein
LARTSPATKGPGLVSIYAMDDRLMLFLFAVGIAMLLTMLLAVAFH